MAEKRRPLGFKSDSEWTEFKGELALALRESGIDSADIMLDGTSTTFYTMNPHKEAGHFFDAKTLTLSPQATPEEIQKVNGDYDFKIYSKALVDSIKAKGFVWKGNEYVSQHKWIAQVYPGLERFSKKWSDHLGRRVSFHGRDSSIVSPQHGIDFLGFKVLSKDELRSARKPSATAKLFEKYNAPTALLYHFDTNGLEALRNSYHELEVPALIQDILSGRDKERLLVFENAKNHVQWNDAGDTFLSINPTYLPGTKLIGKIRAGDVSSIKNEDGGITLITWFIHPKLKTGSIFSPKTGEMRRDLPGKGQKITDLEKGSDPYLASILDLTKDHLQDLKELRQMALSHLKKVYGAQEGKDSIRLEFHFPYGSRKIFSVRACALLNQRLHRGLDLIPFHSHQAVQAS